jgi:hypothetical protein
MKSGTNRIQGRNSNYMDFNPDGGTTVVSGPSSISINTDSPIPDNTTSTPPQTNYVIPNPNLIPQTGSLGSVVDIVPTSSLIVSPTGSIIVETIDLSSQFLPDVEETFTDLFEEIIPTFNLEQPIIVVDQAKAIPVSVGGTKVSSKTFQEAYDKAEKLEPGFKAKLRKVANSIGANEMDLVRVMYKESGLNNTAKNPNTCSAGLIQFTPGAEAANKTKIGCARVKKLGGKDYSMNEILKLSRIEQLDLVEVYFKSGKRLSNIYNLYLYTFYPAAIGKSDSYIFGSESRDINFKFKIAQQNSGIAKFSTTTIDGKRVVTLAAFKAYVNTFS